MRTLHTTLVITSLIAPIFSWAEQPSAWLPSPMGGEPIEQPLEQSKEQKTTNAVNGSVGTATDADSYNGAAHTSLPTSSSESLSSLPTGSETSTAMEDQANAVTNAQPASPTHFIVPSAHSITPQMAQPQADAAPSTADNAPITQDSSNNPPVTSAPTISSPTIKATPSNALAPVSTDSPTTINPATLNPATMTSTAIEPTNEPGNEPTNEKPANQPTIQPTIELVTTLSEGAPDQSLSGLPSSLNATTPSAFDESRPTVTTPQLNHQLSVLKKEVIQISQQIESLENTLMAPHNAQLNAYLSAQELPGFELEGIALTLNNQLIDQHLYTSKEMQALERGAVQRLFNTALINGEHELIATIKGRLDGQAYEKKITITFEKNTKAKYVQLNIKPQAFTAEPAFQFKTWE